MRVATFNVNSVRVRLPIVLAWLRRHAPDFLCLQETKTPDAHFPLKPIEQAGYRALFSGRKGGNGVAILSLKPLEPVALDFDDGGKPEPARFMAARAGSLLIVNTYVPQGREIDHPMYAYKQEWLRRLRGWFERNADPSQPVLWVGDMNVAPQSMDVHHPERHTRHVCFHQDVRKAYEQAAQWGFTDVYRMLNPGEKGYSFYDYRSPNAMEKELGWRIDHIMATASLADCCRKCRVDLTTRRAERPSDHAVVYADFDDKQ